MYAVEKAVKNNIVGLITLIWSKDKRNSSRNGKPFVYYLQLNSMGNKRKCEDVTSRYVEEYMLSCKVKTRGKLITLLIACM